MSPAGDFHVRGGSIYATDPGQDGKVWRPQTMLMPRVSAVYKLGDKTVIKGGYGLYYDTLNAADYGHNNVGFSATTTNTNSTDFGQTFLLGATTWRIEDITRDRVIVTPAPGTPGAVPFWRGDGVGRPAELG